MSFWDFFRKKEKGSAVADSGAGFVPMTGADSKSSDTDAQSHDAHDAGSATSSDSGAGGGDGGGGGE